MLDKLDQTLSPIQRRRFDGLDKLEKMMNQDFVQFVQRNAESNRFFSFDRLKALAEVKSERQISRATLYVWIEKLSIRKRHYDHFDLFVLWRMAHHLFKKRDMQLAASKALLDLMDYSAYWEKYEKNKGDIDNESAATSNGVTTIQTTARCIS